MGGGPRGLAALDALARHHAYGGLPVRATLFEPAPSPGAGPNYDPAQAPLNLLNIPLRDIRLAGAAGIGTFRDWASRQRPMPDEDMFPPRAMMGAYLHARFEALRRSLAGVLELCVVAREVVSCRPDTAGWLLGMADGKEEGPFDEVVLCVGHQPVEDGEIERWRRHASETGAVLADAYPSETLLAAADWGGRTVAIRGFGLAMIDVTRVLTEGLGGRFEAAGPQDGKLLYRPSGREPAMLVPFSLDGMPPAPKPASGTVDERFMVDDEERAAFRDAVEQVVHRDETGLETLFGVLASIAGKRLPRGGKARVRKWLDAGAGDDPEVADDERPAEAMARYLAMAHGEAPASVGYTTGQVWRHLQNDLRQAYNPHSKSAACAQALIDFDEGLKRFSYGPPAEATARLLALVEAGRLSLHRVADPDIACVGEGWRVAEDGGADVASAMVDSVLAGPRLAKVSAPLVAGLRKDGLLVAMSDKLGARVSPAGQALDANGRPVEGLSVLGRLASGAVIASDSLHDCFGEAVERWAKRVPAC